MSAFRERMAELASRLSPQAKDVTQFVIFAEQKRRFSEDRSSLADEFANRALLATPKDDDQ
ncbi:hypothetical protein ACIA8R_12680 [Nonomuraea sp. NPDC051191]|uniref:hypothetical protein n=1 Tax=Nonomuraea sp. NPDC051191 TaxID=3364372 RepID=UPI0037B4A7C6